jgi:hypothetical protein
MGTNCLKRDQEDISLDKRRPILTNNSTTLREATVNGVLVRVIHGEIASEMTDVIVNEANTHLVHAGGIAG